MQCPRVDVHVMAIRFLLGCTSGSSPKLDKRERERKEEIEEEEEGGLHARSVCSLGSTTPKTDIKEAHASPHPARSFLSTVEPICYNRQRQRIDDGRDVPHRTDGR